MRVWSQLSPRTRDAIGSLLGFAACTGLYLANMSTMIDRGQDVPLWVRLGVLGALLGCTLLRRTHPVAALLLGAIPLATDIHLGPTVPAWLVYSDLIYASVLYSGRRANRIIPMCWGVVSVAIIVATAVIATGGRPIALAVIVIFSFIWTPIWWANSVRTHKDIAEIERGRAQALTLVAELDRRAAITDERRTMARDLHDVIAGHLSAIAIQSEAALGVLHRTATDAELTGVVASIRANSVSALQEMRTMIGLLARDDGGADAAAAPRGLAQLPILVDAARAAGLTVRTRVELPERELPSAVDQAAYRITQEALTNAMKHAPGQEVVIEIAERDAELALTVRNRLVRPPHRLEAAGPHRGLLNMGERAAALGGVCAAGAESGGWTVRARLPLARESAA
ncbi:two-component sensor histidine kinase [Nocardia panacis]|uniref:histidine kinase n=1 Tax=Nocardia panacis TaxID=2340916 RepID=A0A3A4KH99_9NOCA|nr:histidine kinase [Nocardia panacis]RJO72912.1 two-component sensor histidine kinase [Nocardia panacis]